MWESAKNMSLISKSAILLVLAAIAVVMPGSFNVDKIIQSMEATRAGNK